MSNDSLRLREGIQIWVKFFFLLIWYFSFSIFRLFRWESYRPGRISQHYKKSKKYLEFVYTSTKIPNLLYQLQLCFQISYSKGSNTEGERNITYYLFLLQIPNSRFDFDHNFHKLHFYVVWMWINRFRNKIFLNFFILSNIISVLKYYTKIFS